MDNESRLTLHGSAEWLRPDRARAAKLFDPGGVLLGQTSVGELLSFHGDGHLLVFAPNGAGKGTGFVQPNLVHYQGSMVVLDPKGENAVLSARRRRELGQRVIVLDPFGQTKEGPSSYNPLASLDLTDKQNVMAELGNFAEALVPERGGADERHWINGARMFVQGILLFMLVYEPRERRNLIRLYDLAHESTQKLDRLFGELAKGDHPDPDVQRVSRAFGRWWKGKNEREFGSFRSIAHQELAWLSDFNWRDVLTGWNERIDLKTQPTTVYLVLPFSRLQRYRNWLRLMVADLTASVMNVPGKPTDGLGKEAPPVLFMLDEAYAGLGRMDLILTAAATIRDAGGRIALVYQDLSQLKSLYEKDWESFLANSGAALFWSVNDLEGMEYVSKRCGVTTVPVIDNMNGHSRPLKFPDEVGAEKKDIAFCFMRSERPARMTRLNVRTDTQRFGQYLDKNPRYGQATARTASATEDRGQLQFDLDGEGEMELTANEIEVARRCKDWSKKLAKKVVENARGEFGYLDESGRFVLI